jgi:hypothetical protein
MDNHVSGCSFGPKLPDLGEEFASLPSRVVGRTPERTQEPVRPLRHDLTPEFECTNTVATDRAAGIRFLLISAFDVKEKST